MNRIFPIVSILFILSFLSCKKDKLQPRDLALLSAHVYDDTSQIDIPQHISPLVSFDEESYKSRLNIDISYAMGLAREEKWDKLLPYLALKIFSKGGYFGRAYVSSKTNHLIIAHRGTDINFEKSDLDDNSLSFDLKGMALRTILNDLDDNLDIYMGKIPQQQYQAYCCCGIFPI